MDKNTIVLENILIIILLIMAFVPDWGNIGRPVISKSSVPIPPFEGISLGDSISYVRPILEQKYVVSFRNNSIEIEGGVDYCGVKFYSAELDFHEGRLWHIYFEDVGSGEDERQLFIDFQQHLFAYYDIDLKVRNADNRSYWHHLNDEHYDALFATLEFSHLPRKYRKNWRERQYGVVSVRINEQ